MKECNIKGASKMSKKEILEMIKDNPEELEGAGFFSAFKRMRENIGRAISGATKSLGRVASLPVKGVQRIFSVPKWWNNISKKNLQKYGDFPVVKLQIYRTPLSGMLNTLMDALSFGKMSELKKKYGFDKFFHLSLIATIKTPQGEKNLIIEKNEAPTISSDYKTTDLTEGLSLPNPPQGLTIKNMMEKTIQKVGVDRFFLYDAFTTNCQRFILDILESNGLETPEAKEFLFQDLSQLAEELPQEFKGLARGLTDIGAWGAKMLGRGEELEGGRDFYCGAKDNPPAGKEFGTRAQCEQRPSQIRRYGVFGENQQQQQQEIEPDSEAEDSEEDVPAPPKEQPKPKPEVPKEVIKEIKEENYPKDVEKEILDEVINVPSIAVLPIMDYNSYPLVINRTASQDETEQDKEITLFTYSTLNLHKNIDDTLEAKVDFINGMTNIVLFKINSIVSKDKKFPYDKFLEENIDFITSYQTIPKFKDKSLKDVAKYISDEVDKVEIYIGTNFKDAVLSLFNTYANAEEGRQQPLFLEVKRIFDKKIDRSSFKQQQDSNILIEKYKGSDILFTFYPQQADNLKYSKCLNVFHIEKNNSNIKNIKDILKEEGKNYVWFICQENSIKRNNWTNRKVKKFNKIIDNVVDKLMDIDYSKPDHREICSKPSLYADISRLGAIVMNRKKNVVEITTVCELSSSVVNNKNVSNIIRIDPDKMEDYNIKEGSRSLYINILCSNGGARDLFRELKKENVLKNENSIDTKFWEKLLFIHLSAINSFNTLNFYYNNGWSRYDSLNYDNTEARSFNRYLKNYFFDYTPEEKKEIFKNMAGIFSDGLYSVPDSPLYHSGLTPYYYFYDDELEKKIRDIYYESDSYNFYNKDIKKNLFDVMKDIINIKITGSTKTGLINKINKIEKYISDNKQLLRESRPVRKICKPDFVNNKLEGGGKNNLYSYIEDIDDADNKEGDEIVEIYDSFNGSGITEEINKYSYQMPKGNMDMWRNQIQYLPF